MSFSVYETQNGCLPIPSSCFSKCVLNSFFKETQAVELVSTCFSVPFCFLINYNSLVMKQGYQSWSFNIDGSAVSFRKLTTAVSTRSVLLSSRIRTRQHIRIAYSFSTHSYNEFWWLINPVNWFFTRVLSEILNLTFQFQLLLSSSDFFNTKRSHARPYELIPRPDRLVCIFYLFWAEKIVKLSSSSAKRNVFKETWRPR